MEYLFMNVNGYKKNKYYYNNCNNICSKNINNSFCNNFNSPLNSLFEVENFLCKINKMCKCINLYKFLNNK